MRYNKHELNGEEVWARYDLQGCHQHYCLCENCELYKPGNQDCMISQEFAELCKKHNIVTPVWECPKFVEKKYEDLTTPEKIEYIPHSKIVKNIDTNGFNFDYRVCRHYERNSEGKRYMFDGKPMYSLSIHEIHFGAYGEIVAYIEEPEQPFGDDLESIRYEMDELMDALSKPIIDFDFVKDQTRRSSRRMKRRIKKEIAAESHLGAAMQNKHDYEQGKVELVNWDDFVAEMEEKHGPMPRMTVEGEE